MIGVMSINAHIVRHVPAYLFERDMMSKEALGERIAFNIDTIMRLVCVAP